MWTRLCGTKLCGDSRPRLSGRAKLACGGVDFSVLQSRKTSGAALRKTAEAAVPTLNPGNC
jgi:hypothetical protein